jgi:Protein of unknown function (DUF2783)
MASGAPPTSGRGSSREPPGARHQVVVVGAGPVGLSAALARAIGLGAPRHRVASGGGLGAVSGLRETLAIGEPDALHQALVEAPEGLSEAEALRLDAKIICLLANQNGDLELARAAIAVARNSSK